MAEKLTTRELDSILDDFIKRLKNKISLDKVVLFGSYAKGTAHEWSDIDLMVISRELPINVPNGANGFFLGKLIGTQNVFPGLELIGVHPDKLNNEVTKSFFDEVLATGREIPIG